MKKKRLRKKKHTGEFAEWGRQLVILRNKKDGFDDFFDAFIEEAIESNGCFCGGGGKEDILDVVVELGPRSGDTDAKMMKVTAWLDAREDVKRWRIGPEFDVWYSERPRYQMKAEDVELRAIVEARKDQPEIKVSIDEL